MPRRSYKSEATYSKKGLLLVGRWRASALFAISLIASALASWYGYLWVIQFPLTDVLSVTDPKVFLEISLVIFYVLWVWGVTNDVFMQEPVYITASSEGKITLQDYAVMAAILLAGAFLLWAHANAQRFAAALVAFFIVNVGSWRYMLHAIAPGLDVSRKEYQSKKDYFEIERLSIFAHYIEGG